MPRTFLCFPPGEPYILGSSHHWIVEDSPLEEGIDILPCPLHDGLPDNEGPYQGPDLLLVERLEQFHNQRG